MWTTVLYFFVIENAQQVAVDVCENRAEHSAKFVSVPYIYIQLCYVV